MKKCYIMRGLPYSGKSKRARELAGETGRVHSTNDYFMVDGVYRYSPFQVRELHQLNLEAFKKSLEEGIPVVVLDNCNVRIWEFQLGIEMAESFGYEIEIVTMPHYPAIKAFREVNWRNIQHESFMRMYEKFENFTFHAPVPS